MDQIHLRYSVRRTGQICLPSPGIDWVIDAANGDLMVISSLDQETTDEFIFLLIQAGWILCETNLSTIPPQSNHSLIHQKKDPQVPRAILTAMQANRASPTGARGDEYVLTGQMIAMVRIAILVARVVPLSLRGNIRRIERSGLSPPLLSAIRHKAVLGSSYVTSGSPTRI